MADFFASSFWTGFLWPLIVMIAQSVLLLVVLLVAIAYILLLLVPLDLVTRSALALAVGPLAGVAWHIATLARTPAKIVSD